MIAISWLHRYSVCDFKPELGQIEIWSHGEKGDGSMSGISQKSGKTAIIREKSLMKFVWRLRKHVGKSLSGVMRPKLNSLTLAQAIMFGGNPVLLITLRRSPT